MQSSVLQVSSSIPDHCPALARDKKSSPGSPHQAQNRFKQHLKTAAHQPKKQLEGKKAQVTVDQSGPNVVEPALEQAKTKETSIAPVEAVAEALPAQLPSESGTGMEQALPPILETHAEMQELLPGAVPDGSTKAAVQPQQASASSVIFALASVEPAVEFSGAEPHKTFPGAEQDVQNAEESEAKTDRIRLMSREHRSHAFLKLKAGPHNGQQQPAAQHASGQARKLMEFENHRLAALKLPETVQTDQENTARPETQTGPDPIVSVRENQPGIRIMARSTPTPAASAQNAVQVEDLFEQIVDRARLMVKMNGAEMTIDLVPDSLGKLSIKVLFEDGLVTARFVTDNHQVKQVLESSLSSLRHNLENQGLKVDRTEVEVQVGNQADFGAAGNWNRGNWGGRDGLEHLPFDLDDEASAADMEAAPESSLTADQYHRYHAEGQMNWLI